MNERTEKREQILMILLWVSVIMGSSYFGISLSAFTLSPYRMFFIVAFVLMCMRRYINIPQVTRPSYVFYGIWTFIALLSIIWAKDKASCIKAGIVIGIAFVSMLISCQFIKKIDSINSILIAISAVNVFVSFAGLYESLTGHYFFVNRAAILSRMAIDKYRAPLVFFTNQNDFSLFIAFGMLVTLYMCDQMKSKWVKIVYYITLAIDLWLMLFAGSRGCLLAFGVGAFIWFFMNIKEMKGNNKVFLLLLIVLALLFYVIIYSDSIINFYNSYFHFGLTTNSTTSDSTRWQLLKNGLDMVLLSGGIGVGAANSSYYLEYVYSNTHGIWALHNWIIQIFSEFGIVIGLGYIIQYVWLIKMLLKKYHNATEKVEKRQALLFVAILFMLLVGTISPSSVLTMEWLWMVFGLIITFIGLQIN